MLRGGDLAVDAPRDRARELFEQLDAHWCEKRLLFRLRLARAVW